MTKILTRGKVIPAELKKGDKVYMPHNKGYVVAQFMYIEPGGAYRFRGIDLKGFSASEELVKNCYKTP